MKKRKSLFLVPLLVLVFLATACQNNVPEVTESSLIIQRNGTVIGALREDFYQEYYNQQELEHFIRRAVEEYNAGREESRHIAVESFVVENQKVALNLSYPSYEQYSEFNGYPLFVGKVSEAMEAGFDFLGSFMEAGNGEINADGDGIPATILESNRDRVVILQEPLSVIVPGNIRYFSAGYVSLISRNTAKVSTELLSTEGATLPLIYIIYR